jgi:multidrug efflux pump subunit AcrA (membrane-fusion protein)
LPRPIKVPSDVSGRLLGVFYEIGPYDMADDNDLIIVGTQNYRRLREGDFVKEGQLLARVDDIHARDDVDLIRTRIVATEAELLAVQYAKEEASFRFSCMIRPQGRVTDWYSQEDVRAAKLACDRYEQEAAAKKAKLDVLQAQLRQAQRQLNVHEIRSPVDGVIKTIHFRRGEAVKQFDTVLEILPADEDK